MSWILFLASSNHIPIDPVKSIINIKSRFVSLNIFCSYSSKNLKSSFNILKFFSNSSFWLAIKDFWNAVNSFFFLFPVFLSIDSIELLSESKLLLCLWKRDIIGLDISVKSNDFFAVFSGVVFPSFFSLSDSLSDFDFDASNFIRKSSSSLSKSDFEESESDILSSLSHFTFILGFSIFLLFNSF